MADFRSKKLRYLVLGVCFDLLGLVSFIIPGIGEFSDIIWAPLAGWLMTRMYRGNLGKVAGVITFVEEILPWLDVLPTFTLMWLYTFVFRKEGREEILEASAS